MIGERVALSLQRERALATVAKWQEANWDRVLGHKRKWRLEHPEQNAECQRRYRQLNKSKIAARHKRWKIANRDLVNRQARQQRERNLEKVKAYQRKFYAENRERLLAERKSWRNNHLDHCRAQGRKYCHIHKEKRRKQSLEYRQRNKEKVSAQTQRWRQSPQGRRKIKERAQRRYREDPQFRIRCLLSARMHKVLKRVGTRKAHHTFDLVGTTPDMLKQHIESQFVPGMTWDNSGDWQIDHKRPCASFDLTQESQQRECFHYSNLQPLWKLDNLRKSAKVLP